MQAARKLILDDDLSAYPRDHVVVIGCGHILRGDDAVGPILIRHLWSDGVPDDVTIVDGGTAGMDVAFKMRGARHVILIDAATTGAEPGTIYRVPGHEVEHLPPLDGLHSHQFRWDHALAFGHWLLGEDYPPVVTVFLIEIAQTEPGSDLSEPVEHAMFEVAGHGSFALGGAVTATVEITAEGQLRMAAEVAAEYFPADSLVAIAHGRELWLLPLVGPEGGGLLLKQRNRRGDRSTLIREALPPDPAIGIRPAVWDEQHGALRVDVR